VRSRSFVVRNLEYANNDFALYCERQTFSIEKDF